MRFGPWAGAALALLLVSCIFETRNESASPGVLRLEVSLKPGPGVLLKRASADTIFKLDSLKIILSAPGEPTAVYAYAITGRPDTGNITVTPKVYTLAPLKTWKAKVLTLDTSLNPARTDTVHLDSASFAVHPGDTTLVSLTLNPVFSILKTRIYSNNPISVTNNVKYVRIRVDGVTRDSLAIGPVLRAASYGSNTVGCAVGDSGIILRTINNGINWTSIASGVTAGLNGVSFPGTNTGYAVGKAGTALKTTTGTAWTAQLSGTTEDLNATYFTGAGSGFAVGTAGTILKSNGTTWTPATATGTTNALNAVFFTSGSNGFAVGNAGTIVKTTNTGSNWTAVASGTTQNLNAVHFPAAGTGYIAGDSGTILKSTNSGANWSALSSGTTRNLNGIFFATATQGWVMGDSGTILYTTNGTSFSVLASGTTQNLNGLGFTPNGNIGTGVGDAGAMTTSTNDVTWTYQAFGAKSFDALLTYKYLRSGLSHTLIMDAIDTLSGALRGYQAVTTLNLPAGKDTTVSPGASLVKCGYSGFSACTP